MFVASKKKTKKNEKKISFFFVFFPLIKKESLKKRLLIEGKDAQTESSMILDFSRSGDRATAKAITLTCVSLSPPLVF